MAKNNSSNQDYTNNSDGWDLSGGTTKRKLTVTGGDISLTGSGSNTYTFPASTDTLVGRASSDTLTNKIITSTTNTVSAATFTNPYKFRIYRNAAFTTGSATFTQIPFDTKQFDTSNNTSTSTGKFTAPVSGYYQFNASVRLALPSANIIIQSSIFINGSAASNGQLYEHTAQSDESATVGDMLQLTAGDLVDIRLYTGAAYALSLPGPVYCYFSGYLVSPA